jgi:hypothetical protein
MLYGNCQPIGSKPEKKKIRIVDFEIWGKNYLYTFGNFLSLSDRGSLIEFIGNTCFGQCCESFGWRLLPASQQ